MSEPRPTHGRFDPRELPASDPATFLTRHFARGEYRYTATLTLELTAEEVRRRVYGPLSGPLTPLDEGRCRVRLSADTVDLVCQYAAVLAALGSEFTMTAPPEVTDRLRALGTRIGR